MSCPPPNPPPFVIDNGSWSIKAGLAGDQSPRVEIPSANAIQNGRIVQWDAVTEVCIIIIIMSLAHKYLFSIYTKAPPSCNCDLSII